MTNHIWGLYILVPPGGISLLLLIHSDLLPPLWIYDVNIQGIRKQRKEMLFGRHLSLFRLKDKNVKQQRMTGPHSATSTDWIIPPDTITMWAYSPSRWSWAWLRVGITCFSRTSHSPFIIVLSPSMDSTDIVRRLGRWIMPRIQLLVCALAGLPYCRKRISTGWRRRLQAATRTGVRRG